MSETTTHDANGADGSGRAHRAGAFDIRNFIGLLLGIYGVVLFLLGIFNDTAAERARASGLNVNLYAGIGMVVVAAGFIVWARLKPVIVPDQPTTPEESEDNHPDH